MVWVPKLVPILVIVVERRMDRFRFLFNKVLTVHDRYTGNGIQGCYVGEGSVGRVLDGGDGWGGRVFFHGEDFFYLLGQS